MACHCGSPKCPAAREERAEKALEAERATAARYRVALQALAVWEGHAAVQEFAQRALDDG
jgi:hypothetical protein